MIKGSYIAPSFTLEASSVFENEKLKLAISGSLSTASEIANLYSLFSHNFIQHLQGPFVIALFDKIKNELFLFRDRLGEKILYWSETPSAFLFASSLPHLLETTYIEERVDFEALSSLLFFGYIPQEKSPIQKVYRLPPGHFLCHNGSNTRIRAYDSLATQLQASELPTFKQFPVSSFVIEATLKDVTDLIQILGEPIGNLYALYAYIECKAQRVPNFTHGISEALHSKIASFSMRSSYFPSFFKLQEHPYLAKILSCFHPHSFFKLLRSSYIHPYHQLFLRKSSLFNKKKLEDLTSPYFKPLDIELFLHRFPALETIGPNKTSLLYLMLKTEIPSLYFFLEDRLGEVFHHLQKSPKTLNSLLQPETLGSQTHSEIRLSKNLIEELIDLLKNGELIRTQSFRKSWLDEVSHKKRELSPRSQTMLFTLGTIEIWLNSLNFRGAK